MSELLAAIIKLSSASPTIRTVEQSALNGQVKIAAISREEAVHSLNRLERLEDSKPELGETVRGAAIGATLAPVATLASRAITGRAALGGPIYQGVRPLAASSAHGAVFGGMVPSARHSLERSVEKRKLKKFIREHEAEKQAAGKWERAAELTGLGTLAVPSIDKIQASLRAKYKGEKGPGAVHKRQILPEWSHEPIEVGGLGILAAPYILGAH